ncbi:MAG TPA: AAA family ATPase [Micromonosporaceae bacterium]|nr:AAA family ATPase [Micromonosporaceae bacterium]
MVTLTITRGLPGSGKTTWARQQRSAVRVNRDDLRRMLHGGWRGTGRLERHVTIVQRATVEALLAAGVDVIVDDTNLRTELVRSLAKLAEKHGAELVVRDFTDVPLEECLRRDAARPPEERVGPEVITAMWARYLGASPV